MNTLRVHKGVVAAGAGLLVALLLLFGKLHTGSEITDPLVKTTPEIKGKTSNYISMCMDNTVLFFFFS